MQLVSNWKAVLQHAWSIRLMLLAGVLSGVEVALPLIDGLFPIPRGVFAGLSGLVVCGAFIARIVVQSKVSGGNTNEPS
ncbi:hypothetical protein [Mesorhizobium sp. Root172]|uniref:DUF7940 domain-containing protein n=1 Tax=Mesorhizobium sp. Root172 TaxID=1736481 RepID=UPI0006F6C35E|nr:hypothetical protein [Mesorhizobium sp. Root172]KRB22666.1 hypothetical protein ASE05_15895 [Mesorhizobium sp. Root172]